MTSQQRGFTAFFQNHIDHYSAFSFQELVLQSGVSFSTVDFSLQPRYLAGIEYRIPFMRALYIASIIIAGFSPVFSKTYAACFDASSVIIDGKGPHEPLTPNPITDKQYKQLETFIASLHGKWDKVDGLHIECFGDADNPRERSIQYVGTAVVEPAAGANLVLRLNLENKQSSTHEKLVYSLEKEILTSTADNDPISTVVTELDENRLVFIMKSVLRSSGDKALGTRPMEHKVTLSRSGNTLNVNREIYIMGMQVSRGEWRLNDKRR
jgi:hypothetical protein